MTVTFGVRDMNIDNEIIACFPVCSVVSPTKGLQENDTNPGVHGMNNDNKRIDDLFGSWCGAYDKGDCRKMTAILGYMA